MRINIDGFMHFYERNFAHIFIGIVFVLLPVVFLILQACGENKSPEERAQFNSQYIESLNDSLVTFSPQPGVVCYVLRGHSSTNPRSMSCVTVTR